MRKVFTGLCAFALAAAGAVLLTSSVMAAGQGQPKVSICHFGIDDITGLPTQEIIAVSNRAVSAHIANHGDYVVGDEICDGVDNDCDGSVDEGDVCSPAVLVCNCFYPEGRVSLTECLDTADQCESAASLCEDRCLACFGRPDSSAVARCAAVPLCEVLTCNGQ